MKCGKPSHPNGHKPRVGGPGLEQPPLNAEECGVGKAPKLTLTADALSATIRRMSPVDGLSERLEFLQGTLEVLILRSLTLGPNHAYGISQFLKQESDQQFVVDNGSLYPALQRLLQRGWIVSQWKTSPNARRAKYYRLTPVGRKQLATATSKWQRFVEAMSRVLAAAR